MDSTNLVRNQMADGVELVYLKDWDVAGVHMRGLAKMIGCDVMTVKRAAEGVTQTDLVELEMPTAGGSQGVTFILEKGVIQVLKTLRRSGCAQRTRDAADDLYDKFAMAGFKLYAMYKAAPEELAAKFAPTTHAPIDELAEVRVKIQAAIDLAGKPGGHAVAAYKALFGAPNQTTIDAKHKAFKPAHGDNAIMARIVTISKAKGTLDAGDARRGISKTVDITAAEIRALFQRLAANGEGRLGGLGHKLTFTAY
jgi:hypothetical protein